MQHADSLFVSSNESNLNIAGTFNFSMQSLDHCALGESRPLS